MSIKTMFAMLLATACVCASHAQEEKAFDAEKTKALFAGTEWVAKRAGWKDESVQVTFDADGTMELKLAWEGHKDDRVVKWTPTGPRSVSGGKADWVMSPDGKEIYATGQKDAWFGFSVYYRGKKLPAEYPFLWDTLAKPGIVWVLDGEKKRDLYAFSQNRDALWSVDGVVKQSWEGLHSYPFGGGQFHIWGKESPGNPNVMYLIQDEKGGRILRSMDKTIIYKPEPIQPGDPLPPQMISRAKSPFNGTSWCRMDGKGKAFTLTFAANGAVSDSAFPNEKPEWTPYDDGSVRYKVKEGSRRLTFNADRKILMREDNGRREVWYSGRQLPRMGMLDTKQLKETLADPSKAWVNWDDSKKTVYIFDAKTANVSITVDDVKQPTVRWEPLCIGCIRIGDEAFMVEGDTLERVEPRLTLKHVPIESVK